MSCENLAPHGLNPHALAPPSLRRLYKNFKSLPLADVNGHPCILDPHNLTSAETLPLGVQRISSIPANKCGPVFERFVNNGQQDKQWSYDSATTASIFEHKNVPGLHIYPSLLPPGVQRELLSRLIHRDLVCEDHKTNLHMHYSMSYPKEDSHSQSGFTRNKSLFGDEPSRKILPKDSSIHQPLSVEQVLKKKLRWVTLGGQYDWTEKVYPGETPPAFPEDVASLIQGLFPSIKAEAAIVNFYSPGDVLSVHRDVSEECDVPLISISIGDDALFLIGHADDDEGEIVRLRSGDAVCMSGPSRFAWHAVPKILPGTCPEWLRDWPGDDEDRPEYKQWKGWMAGKRINLNVRQMKSS